MQKVTRLHVRDTAGDKVLLLRLIRGTFASKTTPKIASFLVCVFRPFCGFEKPVNPDFEFKQFQSERLITIHFYLMVGCRVL